MLREDDEDDIPEEIDRDTPGISILYADDDTDNVSDSDMDILQSKIQMEANKSTSWVKDNKLFCSGSKTKLYLLGPSHNVFVQCSFCHKCAVIAE